MFDAKETSTKLIDAVRRAQEKGKYSLNDASLIFKAVSYLERQEESTEIKDELAAFQVLVSSIEVAQTKGGVFDLEEASSLYRTIMDLVEYSKAQTEKAKGKAKVTELTA